MAQSVQIGRSVNPFHHDNLERVKIGSMVLDQYEDLLEILLQAILRLLQSPNNIERIDCPDVYDFLNICRDWGGVPSVHEASARFTEAFSGSKLHQEAFSGLIHHPSSPSPQPYDRPPWPPTDMSLIKIATNVYEKMKDLREALTREQQTPQYSKVFLNAPSVAADSPKSIISDIVWSNSDYSPSCRSIASIIPDEMDGCSVECEHWHHFVAKPRVTSCNEKQAALGPIMKISICAADMSDGENRNDQLGFRRRWWQKLSGPSQLWH